MKCFGLIGHPLGHSFSARYFAEKFAAEGIDARYDNYDLADIGEVETLRRLSGFNVTIPYKQAVIPYLDGMSDEARAIGAVNTVRVENGCFYGYNTDVIGFRESLRDWLSEDNASVRSALVLGTGGASKAVCYALTQLGIAWQLVSRTPKEGCLTYNDLRKETVLASIDLIVNCTPSALFQMLIPVLTYLTTCLPPPSASMTSFTTPRKHSSSAEAASMAAL